MFNATFSIPVGGHNFAGRIPLILNCKHSVCQECVYKMYPSKDIICPECHASNFITDLESKKKADQVFSINFYVFGALTYHKRYAYETSTVNFKPAGFQFKHSQQHRRQDYQPNSFLSFSPTQQHNCSQLNLKVEERQQGKELYVCIFSKLYYTFTHDNCGSPWNNVMSFLQ